MKIFPAIDLYGGKAVRLRKGDYQKMTVYSDDPHSVACDFIKKGAECIHLVDLEGARDGSAKNSQVLKKILGIPGLFSEIGGGIRSIETIENYLSAGASRVILGTAAVENEELITDAVRRFGTAAVAVGADVKDGFIAVKGWLEDSGIRLWGFARRMQDLGVSAIICTDISRDGEMRGANLNLYKELKEALKMEIVASGGVTDIGDIAALKESGIDAAIIGKAYYEGAIDLAEAVRIAK